MSNGNFETLDLTEKRLCLPLPSSDLTPIIPLTLAINIYFRKSFSFADHTIQLIVCFALFLLTNLPDDQLPITRETLNVAVLTFLLAGFFVSYRDLNLDFQDAIQFVCTAVNIYFIRNKFNLWQEVKTEQEKVVTLFLWNVWVVIPILALFQLIRNPKFIKEILRPIRVGLGPASFLWAVSASVIQLLAEFNSEAKAFNLYSYVFMALSVITFVCSSVAVIIFRPDNLELFRRISPKNIEEAWPYRDRVTFHGALNVTAVFCAISMLVLLKL